MTSVLDPNNNSNDTPLSHTNKPRKISLIDIMVFTALLILGIHGFTLSQRLIETAKIDFLRDRVVAVDHAWHTFKTHYHAIPGDFAYASVHIDSDLKNGDGNGRIDSDLERGQAWAHLASAGLLPNAQTDGNPISDNPSACNLSHCPNNSWGKGMMLSFGNYGLQALSDGNQLLLGTNIPVSTLWGLDQQLDDGSLKHGKIQVSKPFPGFSQKQMERCLDQKATTHNFKVRCAGIVALD